MSENLQPPVRVAIDDAAFALLVQGKPVVSTWHRSDGTIVPIEIVLKDIGWGVMLKAIADAMAMLGKLYAR